MALPARARWCVLGVAAALTLVAARLVGREDEGLPSAPVSGAAGGIEPATGRAGELPALDLDRLAARRSAAPAGDPFRALSWQSDAQEEARRNAPPSPPAPPPPPQAPQLPFTYMGKLVESGRTVVFLTRGEDNYVVREGDTIDRAYRVDAITEDGLALTYLPLKQKQKLVFGGAQ